MDNPPVPNAQERKRILERLRKKERPTESSDASPPPEGLLSPAQNAMWLAWKLAPESSAFQSGFQLRFEGALQIDALEKALNAVVHRHENLRSHFPLQGDKAVQRCHEWAHTPLPVHDLTADSRNRAEPLQARLIKALKPIHAPFALETGPVLRWLLVRHAENQHSLHVVIHHIVFDAWSRQIFVRELARFYNHHVLHPGAPLSPEPAPLQGRTWNRRQQELTASPAHERSLHYWKQKLAAPLTTLSLPFERPPKTGRNGKTGHRDLLLSTEQIQHVEELARATDCTLFMVLLSVLRVVLHRYTQQTDLVIGVPVAGRTQPDSESLVGCLINTLPVRQTLNPSIAFRDHLLDTRRTLLTALDHSQADFSTIVESVAPHRMPHRHPLLQVLLNYRSEPKDQTPWHGIETQLADIPGSTGGMDLCFDLDPVPTGLRLRCTFETNTFAASDVQRFLNSYHTALEHALLLPQTEVGRLHVLNAEDRTNLLSRSHPKVSERSPPESLPTLFERLSQLSKSQGDATAVDGPDGVTTYRDLHGLTCGMAHCFRGAGIEPGDMVAIALPHSASFIAASIALLRCGATFVALDPAYPPERLQFMLEDSKATHLILPKGTAPAWASHIRCLHPGEVQEKSPAFHSEVEEAPSWPPEDPRRAAYIIYTSGSTGRPNGVAVSQSALLRHLEDCRAFYQYQPADRVLSFAALSFDAALEQTFTPLVAGASVVFRPKEILSPHDFSRYLARHEVTVADLPPSLWLTLTQIWAGPHLPREASRLRLVIVGGEEMPLAGAELWMKSALKAIRLVNAYGPTETVITSTVCDVTQTWPTSEPWSRVPIGSFLGHRQGYILDVHGQLLPEGVPGELHIGGELLALGYIHRPSLNEARFLPDPFSTTAGQRMYRTGDRCRWRNDGQLEFLGRLDEQVKLRGFRIELGEIETALLAIQGIGQATALIVGNDNNNGRIVAALVERPGFKVERDSVAAQLRSKLPGFMVPSQWLWLEQLPTLPNGKLDRTTLAQWADSRVSETTPGTTPHPLTPEESKVATLWQKVLRRENLGKHDNFFDLGGDSLQAMRLIMAIAQDYGVEIPISTLFESRDLADFTTRLQKFIPPATLSNPTTPAEASTTRPEVEEPSPDHAPLSFCQEQLYILGLMQPQSTVYQITDAWRIHGPLQIGALQQALRQVIERQSALRLTWVQTDSGVEQRLLSPDQFPLTLEKPGGNRATDREAYARLIVDTEKATPLQWLNGKLFRARLVEIRDSEHLLIMTTHHGVTDGWSEPVMLQELGEAYTAALESRNPSWPPLPVSFLRHAARQRSADAASFESDISYWKMRLQNVPAHSHPPLDRPRHHQNTFQGASVQISIPVDTRERVQSLSRSQSMSLFMVCTTAVRLWLMRSTNKEDVVLGSASTGRHDPRTHGLIGFFVHMLPLRLSSPWTISGTELLQDTKRVVLEAFEHSTVPFEKLVKELHPQRIHGANPLFQVVVLHEKSDPSLLSLHSLRTERISAHDQTSKFDLTFAFRENADGFALHLEYSTELFQKETAERMARQTIHFLDQLVSCPDRPLFKFSPFPPTERIRILQEWNQIGLNKPVAQCIHQVWSEQAARTPEAVAVVSESGRWTYRQLEEASSHLAMHLRSRGVRRGVLVGVLMERSWEFIVSLVAILKAGGAYLPLSTDAPSSWQLEMMRHARLQLLLTEKTVLQDWPVEGLQIHEAKGLLDQPLPAASDSRLIPEEGNAEDLAYVMYTSGSTGKPKGVMIPHRGVVRLVKETNYADFSANQTFLLFAPVSFDASTLEIWGPLLNGGTLALAPAGRSTLEDLARTLHQHAVTTLWLTSGLFNIVADERPEILRGLQQLLIGGDILSVPHLRRVRDLMPQCRIINGYGPTENTTFSCCHTILDQDLEGDSIPIGRPIGNSEAYVLDAFLQPVPIGVEGELFVGGQGLALGYLHQPELTSERFIPHPFHNLHPARLYKTGDQARYRPDGTLEFLGRNDHQVKIRGFRIELGTIESHLGACEDLRQCAVIATGKSSDQKRLVAFCVLKKGGTLSPSRLREQLSEHLPDYMIPTTFVERADLPLNANGKVDRRALEQTAPEPDSSSTDFIAPRNEAERKMASLWQELLQLPRVGVNQNFFELGGHSLLAVRLFERIHQIFGCRLPLAALFEHPTIAALVALLEAKERHAHLWSLIVPIRSTGSRIPFFCIHGGGGEVLFARDLVRYLHPEIPFFGIQARGLHNTLERHQSIDEMATAYLEEIARAHPKGPILLGGYCMGGLVAYEMARRLQNSPLHVRKLILIDSINHSEMQTPAPLSDQRRWLKKLTFQWGNLSRLNFSDQLRYVRQRAGSAVQRRTLWARRSVQRWFAGKGIQREWSPGDPVLNENHSAQIIRGYRPAPSQIPTVLFRPEHDPEMESDPTLGWERVLGAHLEVVSIPVFPGGMLVEPFIGMLGREINLRIESFSDDRSSR